MAEAVIEIPRSCSMPIQSEPLLSRLCVPHHAGRANHARIEQQLFRQRGLPRIRMADDGEGPALGRGGSQFILL